MSALRSLVGVLLLAVPFIPLLLLFPDTPGATALVSPPEWLLGVFVAAALAWLAALFLRPGGAGSLERWSGRFAARRTAHRLRSRPWLPAAILCALAVLLVVVSREVFRHRPLLVDSIVQLFQAKMFAAGGITAPRPPEAGFFTLQHFLEGAGGWYAQYPPGHSALLALGVAVATPWVIPVLLSVGSACLMYLFAREAYDRRTALLTLFLLLLAPFFWFMGASFMNHVSSLFFICLALYLLARWEKGGSTAALVGAAAAVGAVFTIRPVDALAVGLVLGGWAAWRCLRTGRAAALVPAALAGLATAGLYLIWNATTTGDPFLPGYIELWGSAHGLGFHESPTGASHTPLTGLRNELIDLALLNLFLFEWPVPALLPVGLYFALRLDSGTWDRLLLAAAVAIPAAYLFYWHRDAYLGPRFLYASVAFFIPLTARAILAGAERLRERQWGAGGLRVDARAFMLSLLFVCFAYSIAYGTPQRFRIYSSGLSSLKVDLEAEAGAAGIEEGLVFVAVSWGNRLITGLRAHGVPASDVEKAYRRVDHCDLQHALSTARASGWSSGRLVDELRRLQADTDPRTLVATAELNGDPTLRVRRDRSLAPDCVDEVKYDRSGITNFEPHLLVNRPTLDGRLVVARDLRGENARLRAHYPDRAAYLWRGTTFEPLP